jgi:mannose-6-phosphate isomerase-like protein (cupin superfamily)
MTVRLNKTNEGDRWSAAGCDFRVLEDGQSVKARWGIVECTLAPAWGGPPQHVHREHDESFFVLTGTVRFTSGREELIATPGSLVTAPIGDPHTFANADSEAPASLLCTVTPERYLGYLKELTTLRPGSNGLLDPAEILAIMSRYATEPYRA